MFDDTFTAAPNVVSLADVRAKRQCEAARPLRARLCCHCGAALGEGESEDECSGAGFSAASVSPRRRAE